MGVLRVSECVRVCVCVCVCVCVFSKHTCLLGMYRAERSTLSNLSMDAHLNQSATDCKSVVFILTFMSNTLPIMLPGCYVVMDTSYINSWACVRSEKSDMY